ncbi:hypothetical protein LIER_17237 [Lithospermum erythrorhizon]|uniref:Uncharacterized protein n=1 Tax=Lithospermum erythrorhizon TaxID=34254 RepID=A0AAV3QBY2_LITER
MPVSGNREPGVLSQRTSICSSSIPIKKRRIPFILPPSPPREDEATPISEMNNTEDKRESTGIDLSVVANTSKDSIQKSDVINNSLKDVKKEIAPDIITSSMQTDVCTQPLAIGSSPPTQLDVKKVSSVLRVISGHANAYLGTPRDEEIGSVDLVNCNISSLFNEISASHAVANNNSSFPSVKKEMVNIRPSGDHKHELSTALGQTMLPLTLNKLVGSPFGNQKVDFSTKVPDKLDPPLLSLSFSGAELPESLLADKTVTDSNVIMSSTDRSNWDLNTTMDAWEGSMEDASSNDTIGADELSSSDRTHNVKHFLSSTSAVNVRVDKGKQVMEHFEERSPLCIPSMSFKQFNANDSLRLSLSTSSPQDSSRVLPHLILQRPIISSISSGSGIVKSEPVDENLKPHLSLVPGVIMESSNNRLANKRNAESCEATKTLVGTSHKLIEPTSFKSEVSQEINKETHSAANFLLKQPSGNVIQHQESCSSSSTVVSGSRTPQEPFASKLSICSELTACVGIVDQSEHDSNTTGIKTKDIMNPSITSAKPEPVNSYCEDPNLCDDDKVNSIVAMTSSLRSGKTDTETNNTITEESASDKEKMSAMVEDHSYDSDYESDGNHAVVCQMGTDDGQCEKVDDDYEDGEVREFTLKSLEETPICEGMLSENIKEADDGCVGVPTDQPTISERHSDNNENYECIEAMTNENNNELVSDYDSLQVASVQTEPKVPEKSPIDLSVEEKVPGVEENELMGDGEINMKDLVLATVTVARNENDKGSNVAGIKDNLSNVDGVPNSSLSKEEVTMNDHGSFNDSALGVNRSRIITLPRASDSPSRMRSLSGRAFTLWSGSGRERYGGVDGDNLHYRGHRDDTYGDGSRKFSRDQSFRNSRMDFKHDRGRGNGRLESLQNKWDPGHDFPSRSFDVSADYRFNRNGHPSAVSNNGIMSNDYATPDGTGRNACRIGRKPLIEEFNSFRQPSSRRLSPGSRDGTTVRSLPNLRKIPESGSDLPGRRHEKFLRGLPDDISGSVYSRPQASYDEMNGQFVRGNQEYSTLQRRTFTRARSKSPVSTQSRSPGSWPSSRRRFSDDFNNPSDQIQHRSVMYRVERMRSPDRVCYTDELGDRRRVSPNYVSRRPNEMRDIDFAREHGSLRSVSSNRSPSDRVFTRTTRRLDVVDSRERTESGDYFSGPIRSGRFHEFRRDGSNDERRKFGERRGQFRPSRPSYGGVNENHRFNAEDGSRSLRCSSDQDTESLGRSNVRQRDFHEGAKPRPLIAQRQIRNTEDQEGSFGQTGQIWHDESFSDHSRMKRRRF